MGSASGSSASVATDEHVVHEAVGPPLGALAVAGAVGVGVNSLLAPGLYEPIHGSAPDIAGQGMANPLATILSFEMALRWSLGRPDLADRLGAAVAAALEGGARTRDIGGDLTTREMGDAVLVRL